MFIVSTGMVCSVGLTAAAACAAMRAGIAGFDELPYLDNQGEPIIGAMVPGLDTDLKRGERLVEMLSMALTDCLSKQPNLNTEQTPLLLGLAEAGRPGGSADMADTIIGAIEEKQGARFHPQYSRAIPKGHTAGFEGLRIARELFAQDASVTDCLVCGVDSYINARSLLWLDQDARLKTPESQHGLIPGEAATVSVVQPASSKQATVELIGLGFGFEKAGVLSEEPLLGLGLTEAARTALAEANRSYHEIDWRISDVSGEQYSFKELPLVEARLARVVRKEAQPISHCTESIGDCGAAAGMAQLVVAEESCRVGYSPGELGLCMTSAVPGDRAAVMFQLALQ